MKSKLPKHMLALYKSNRAFKQTKRRQLRALEKALNNFRLGCAFIPGAHSLASALDVYLTALKAKTSVREWGR